MNVLQDLQALQTEAQTPEVKGIIASEIDRVKAEAQSALSEFEAHVATYSDEAKALWAKIKAAL